MKILTRILFTFALTSFVACKTGNDGSISLFNETEFILNKNEAQMGADIMVNEMYTKYFNKYGFQVPLYKYIKSKDHQIFIGLPVGISLIQAKQAIAHSEDMNGIEEDSSMVCSNYQVDGMYMTELFILTKGKNLLYVSTLTNEKQLSDSLFKCADINERIVYD